MAKKQKSTYCPNCDNTIVIAGSVRMNQKFLCKTCRTELEVVDLHPLTLDWAFDFEDTADSPYEDYADYDDRYYYDLD